MTRIRYVHVLMWGLHLSLSFLLVGSSAAPGWRQLLLPGSLGPRDWLHLFLARVITSPLVPVAEAAGLGVWRGYQLAGWLALNSVLWVVALGWLARQRPRRG